MTEYRARRIPIEGESAFTFENGSLVRAVGGRPVQRLALADVRQVVLVRQPLVFVARWICFVEGRGVRIWIPSCSFTSLMQAADQRAAFRPFVEALNHAIATAAPATPVRFIVGAKWSSRASLAALASLGMLSALLLLATIIELATGIGLSNIGPTAVFALILAGVAAVLWRVAKKNWRHAYDPNALPADFAPVT